MIDTAGNERSPGLCGLWLHGLEIFCVCEESRAGGDTRLSEKHLYCLFSLFMLQAVDFCPYIRRITAYQRIMSYQAVSIWRKSFIIRKQESKITTLSGNFTLQAVNANRQETRTGRKHAKAGNAHKQ